MGFWQGPLDLFCNSIKWLISSNYRHLLGIQMIDSLDTICGCSLPRSYLLTLINIYYHVFIVVIAE